MSLHFSIASLKLFNFGEGENKRVEVHPFTTLAIGKNLAMRDWAAG